MNDIFTLFKSIALPFELIDFPVYGSSNVSYGFQPYVFKHNSASDIQSESFTLAGFEFGTNAMLCHILIGTRYTDVELTSLNDYQKVCHFHGTNLIGSKDELHFRMKELKNRFGHSVDFYPIAYYPPDDYEELLVEWPTRPVWIVKAPSLSRARFINVVRSKDEPCPKLPYVVEEYISPPYLITGRKFDIRLYALVTSIEPLIIYFHYYGLALFATHAYQEDGDPKDLMMHLTNYEINKDSADFVACQGLNEKIENSKWSLPFLWEYFKNLNQNIDLEKLKQDIEDVATQGIIAGMCAVRNLHREKVKNHRKSSFEIFGVDILLDSNLKPYLLEINVSPGMSGSSELDKMVKFNVNFDMYNIVRIPRISADNRYEFLGYRGYEVSYCHSKNKDNRSEKVTQGMIDPWENPTFAEYTIIREFAEEQERRRGFHRAYPRKINIEKFEKCFDKYSYEDVVLNKWLLMDKKKRFDVLTNNFDIYYFKIRKIFDDRNKILEKEEAEKKKDKNKDKNSTNSNESQCNIE